MKFYISTPELNDQISSIRRTIRLSMNGVVSDAMKEKGIVYKSNYGVSIPRLREIAKKYNPGHDLAQRLWMLQIRETMILATLLEPADKFTKDLATQWAENFNQTEIIEQTCMNLLCKCSFAQELVGEWIAAENEWLQTAGFILGARIHAQFSTEQAIGISQTAIARAADENKTVYKAAAVCLARLCRNNKETATYILKATEPVLNRNATGVRYIYEEVKQEIIFLDIL